MYQKSVYFPREMYHVRDCISVDYIPWSVRDQAFLYIIVESEHLYIYEPFSFHPQDSKIKGNLSSRMLLSIYFNMKHRNTKNSLSKFKESTIREICVYIFCSIKWNILKVWQKSLDELSFSMRQIYEMRNLNSLTSVHNA